MYRAGMLKIHLRNSAVFFLCNKHILTTSEPRVTIGFTNVTYKLRIDLR